MTRNRIATIITIMLAASIALPAGQAVAGVVLDMPPPPNTASVAEVRQSDGEETIPDVGTVALYRYANARQGTRDTYWLYGSDPRYRSYGPHYYPYGYWYGYYPRYYWPVISPYYCGVGYGYGFRYGYSYSGIGLRFRW